MSDCTDSAASIHRTPHYTFSAIEPVAAIEAWQLGFHLGCVVK
jgi:hypothetical protein